jgi:histidyl-tRNA synthetase
MSQLSEKLQAIRGMCDVLPDETQAWRTLERAFADCALSYAYREVRLPLLENTALFKRSIGEVTDIVEKEMYSFIDRNGDSLTLRPEGTAGCVRACLEHGLLHNQQQKLWYIGPMFRHEKPQKGRYRQFTQLGLEAFGISGAGIELEMIMICKRLWETLGIADALTLEINTLGSLAERQAYRETLIQYFKQHQALLDEDSVRRLEKNPMRILDSKNPAMHQVIENAPKLLDTLSEESREYFSLLCRGLDSLDIKYTVNSCLVRGLDYYEHTVFEWTTDQLGSQATVCAGGRFDKLVEHLGGRPTPAVGFAMGAERLILLMHTLAAEQFIEHAPTFYVIAEGELGLLQALRLAEILHEKEPKWRIIVNTSGGSFKNQFKKADKSGARIALVLGEDEVRYNKVGLKDLRQSKEQQLVLQSEVYQAICEYIGE